MVKIWAQADFASRTRTARPGPCLTNTNFPCSAQVFRGARDSFRRAQGYGEKIRMSGVRRLPCNTDGTGAHQKNIFVPKMGKNGDGRRHLFPQGIVFVRCSRSLRGTVFCGLGGKGVKCRKRYTCRVPRPWSLLHRFVLKTGIPSSGPALSGTRGCCISFHRRGHRFRKMKKVSRVVVGVVCGRSDAAQQQ